MFIQLTHTSAALPGRRIGLSCVGVPLSGASAFPFWSNVLPLLSVLLSTRRRPALDGRSSFAFFTGLSPSSHTALLILPSRFRSALDGRSGVAACFFFFFFSFLLARLRSALDGRSLFCLVPGVHSINDLVPALLSRDMFSSHTDGLTTPFRFRSALDGRSSRRFAVVGRQGPGSSLASVTFLLPFFRGLPFLKISLSTLDSASRRTEPSFFVSVSQTDGFTRSSRFFPADPGRSEPFVPPLG